MLSEIFFSKQPVNNQSLDLPTPILVSDTSVAAESVDHEQPSPVAESPSISASTTVQAAPPTLSASLREKTQ